jgi:hypothetical protein
MMSKKISIAPRPSAREADDWVSAPAKKAAPVKNAVLTEKMSRLTIDIPASLHRRLKAECATEGVKMADVVRELLTKKYG